MEGEILGDFKILKEIGRGPLGFLYLGEHKFIKKKFAIKILPDELVEDSEFMVRFESKIAKIAMLDHVNIVKVHNISSCNGVFFIVSDFIGNSHFESTNLSTYLSNLKNRLSECEILSILKMVASALDYIHSKELDGKIMFHGSVKLNNIIIGKIDGVVQHLYLTDTGLNQIIGQGRILSKIYSATAKALEVDSKITGLEGDKIYSSKNTDIGKLTKLHRSFLQNYAFLSPEQKLSGVGDNCGYKSDVYSFGILSYFLLMGYLPEGFFIVPSKSKSIEKFKYNWDILIESTLRQSPDDRPDNLTSILERVATCELKDIESTIDKISNSNVKGEKKKTASTYTSLYAIETNNIDEQLSSVNLYNKPRSLIYEKESEKEIIKSNVDVIENKRPIINQSEFKKLEYDDDPGVIFQSIKVVTSYKSNNQIVENLDPLLCEMIVIKEGEYWRGSSIGARDEKPKHKIIVDSFAIDIHQVTNEQYIRFLELMGCDKESNNNDMILLKESRIKRVSGKLSIESGYAKHPVVGVSWYGAVAYAKWAGKRLPTEAEWEIAASCVADGSLYTFGSHIDRTQANYFNSDTTVVMSYPANSLGLYDVAGNVYEWCEDWYCYNYYEHSLQEPNNPKGPAQGVYRVLRGGCWKSSEEDLRVSHRHRNNPGTMTRTYGFRLAADVL